MSSFSKKEIVGFFWLAAPLSSHFATSQAQAPVFAERTLLHTHQMRKRSAFQTALRTGGAAKLPHTLRKRGGIRGVRCPVRIRDR